VRSSTSVSTASRDDPLQLARRLVDSGNEGGDMTAILRALITIIENQQRQIDSLKEQRLPIAAASEDQAEFKERKRSIVIMGLPEASGKPSDRQRADKSQLAHLFDELDVEAEVVATYRMGVKKDGGPRLTKVVLAASQQQKTVLVAAKKLKASTSFKGVFVRPSMTPAERDEDYRLRQQLRELRQAGRRVIIKGWPGEERKIVEIPVQGNH